KLVERAAQMGQYLLGKLRALQAQYPVMGDVRGRGLMVGVEFTDKLGEPDADTTSAVVDYCVKHRLLILNCGSYKNVVRFIPPLTISQAELDEGLAIFSAALAAA
ncbi:MAG: aminotransferase class III-fold pyridoxal phosphate-dependent enzyme, partial [Anaerolineales bacterium]|nr:aminotransferase class III-fold pyridoxal phosphate-dependent enzyme [Anaerolineales bacterium]